MDHSLSLDGASLAWPWSLPFVGILLSIAVGPLLFPKAWPRALRQNRAGVGGADDSAAGGGSRWFGGAGDRLAGDAL